MAGNSIFWCGDIAPDSANPICCNVDSCRRVRLCKKLPNGRLRWRCAICPPNGSATNARWVGCNRLAMCRTMLPAHNCSLAHRGHHRRCGRDTCPLHRSCRRITFPWYLSQLSRHKPDEQSVPTIVCQRLADVIRDAGCHAVCQMNNMSNNLFPPLWQRPQLNQPRRPWQILRSHSVGLKSGRECLNAIVCEYSQDTHQTRSRFGICIVSYISPRQFTRNIFVREGVWKCRRDKIYDRLAKRGSSYCPHATRTGRSGRPVVIHLSEVRVNIM